MLSQLRAHLLTSLPLRPRSAPPFVLCGSYTDCTPLKLLFHLVGGTIHVLNAATVPHLTAQRPTYLPSYTPSAPHVDTSYVQLNSLLSKGLSKTAVDRPINVEGCSAASISTLRAPHGDTFPGGAGRREKTPPVVATTRFQKPSRGPHPGRRGNAPVDEARPEQDAGMGEGGEDGGVTALSLAEFSPSPPFFGDHGAAASSPPSCSRQNGMGPHLDQTENANANTNTMVKARRSPESLSQGNINRPTSQKRNASLPTVSLFSRKTKTNCFGRSERSLEGETMSMFVYGRYVALSESMSLIAGLCFSLYKPVGVGEGISQSAPVEPLSVL